jgi:prevent-host-death family protein
MNNTFNVPITKLRQNAAKVINEVTTTGQSAIIIQRSQPKAVITDLDYFNSLETAVIDLLDAREAERAKKETKIPLKDYLKKRWGE